MRRVGLLMKPIFLTTVSLYFCCLTFYGQTMAALIGQEIIATPEGIHIQVQDHALGEVLAYIQQVSGIRFTLPRAMGTTLVTAAILAPNWPTAIRELLRPFNTAEAWDEGGTELYRVFVLARGQARLASDEGNQPQGTDLSSPPSAASLPLPPPLPPPPLPQRNP